MTRSRIAVWMCAVVVGLAAVACGGDDDDSADTTKDDDTSSETTAKADSNDLGDTDEAAYIDAIVEASEDPSTTDEQERCFAQAFMTSIGVDGMVEAGVTPDDIRNEPDASPAKLGITFTDDQRETLWTEANQCVDITDLLVSSFDEGDVYTDEQLACLKDGFDEDLVKSLFLSSMTEGDDYEPSVEVTQQLATVMGQCGMAG